MKLHIIRSPLAHASRSTWGDPKTALAPLNKGGTGKTYIKVPLFKGDQDMCNFTLNWYDL
jgi:hypothetical protein